MKPKELSNFIMKMGSKITVIKSKANRDEIINIFLLWNIFFNANGMITIGQIFTPTANDRSDIDPINLLLINNAIPPKINGYIIRSI